MRRLISTGSGFERQAGYSRAVVDGDWVHVAGTTGFDYSTGTLSDDPVEQAEQALRTIEATLRDAGSGLEEVVRVRYYITDAALFPVLAPVFARRLGAARPAATCVVVGLIDPRLKIEIEVTAHRAGAG